MKQKNSIFEVVKEAVDEWDVYALLLGGAPKDEFDSESKAIAVQINGETSIEDITHIILKVFKSSFGDIFSFEECAVVAEKIKAKIKK